MSTTVSSGAQQTLQRFLEGDCSPEEFDSWLVTASDDEAAVASERDALARLRLIMIECGEGLRSPDELVIEVAALLTESTSNGVAVWTTTAGTSASTLAQAPFVAIKQIESPA